ncbi:MAG: sirohydrochlorin chelatase [Mycobacterium sp.]|nr:sirohydrochlorin chelatase [Mycobacterium sp.]
MRAAFRMSRPVLVLTAHGSVDPRAAVTTLAVAERVRRDRPALDVRVAFCEKSTPCVCDVVADLRADAVVTPLLLADAYHARVDIPAMIARSGAVQAEVLGVDDRLVKVLRQRVCQLGVSRLDPDVGVVVVAVGSSQQTANVRTNLAAPALVAGTRWAGAVTAFATGPGPSLGSAAERLRAMGARRLVIAPWFLAHGRITDRVADFAARQAIPMSQPLGSHRLVAATVLARFDRACADAERLAA